MILSEALWRYLSAVNYRDPTTIRPFLQIKSSRYSFFRRFAMQGFGEDHIIPSVRLYSVFAKPPLNEIRIGQPPAPREVGAE